MKKITFTFILLTTFCCTILAQQTRETYTLQQLQSIFKHKNYTENVLLDFQKTMSDLREKPQLHEDIPGEVISWATNNGRYSWHKTYLIQKDKLQEVQTLPNDDLFLKKINSYVPEKSRFAYLSDLWSFAFVKEKLKDNFYLITATAKSYNSHPEMPNDDILMYDFEYKTNDFKEFQLVRLKESNSQQWIEVKE